VLTLFVSRTHAPGLDLAMHRLTQDWGEQTSDAAANEGSGAPAIAGDATWLHTVSTTGTWTTARFNSRENTVSPPALTIDYTPIPEPGVAIVLQPAIFGGLLARRRC